MLFDSHVIVLDVFRKDVPQYKRDFRRKLVYFRSQHQMKVDQGQCHIAVRRANIFEDSYDAISRLTASDLKRRLMIKFQGEEGLDYGGVSRFVAFHFLLFCFQLGAHCTWTESAILGFTSFTLDPTLCSSHL